MMAGNITVVMLWDVGLWIPSVVAFSVGCVAVLFLWHYTQESMYLSANGAAADSDGSVMSRLWPCLVPTIAFVVYSLGHQQHYTSWYLQTKEMDMTSTWLHVSSAPGSMQSVLYATRVFGVSAIAMSPSNI